MRLLIFPEFLQCDYVSLSFYVFCFAEDFGLQGSSKDYHYLNQSGVYLIDGKDDKQDYTAMTVRNHFTIVFYSTITSFYHIRTRERAKYESILHCSKSIAV